MKSTEVRNLTNEELNKKVIELKEELFTLRFQHAAGQLENTARLKEIRKTIARIKTIIRERELNKQ